MTASILDVIGNYSGQSVADRMPARLSKVNGLPNRFKVVHVPDYTGAQNIWDGGGTVMSWINPTTAGESDTGRVFDKAQWQVYPYQPSGEVCYLVFTYLFSGDNGIWRTTVRDITLGQVAHLAITYDANAIANNPTIYLDGVQKTVGSGLNTLQAPTGARTTDVGSDLYIGNRAAGDREFDGQINEPLPLYSSALTSTQILNYFNENKSRYGL